MTTLGKLEQLVGKFAIIHLWQGSGLFNLQLLEDTGAEHYWNFQGNSISNIVEEAYKTTK